MEDDNIYLEFSGYHSVAAASDLLSSYHITNRIVKMPIAMRKSCSFAVMIRSCDEEMSRFLLSRRGIRIL